ncbi:hypothetical protein TNCV_2112701 [Trichonephila clavipes]|nr:hypothetical protein TNCV_2112701 [Trichonephila clavipes]
MRENLSHASKGKVLVLYGGQGISWEKGQYIPRVGLIVPVKLSNKWVRDQKSIPSAGASRIEEYTDAIRTVAVRRGNSEFRGPSFIPSNIGRVNDEKMILPARWGTTHKAAMMVQRWPRSCHPKIAFTFGHLPSL